MSMKAPRSSAAGTGTFELCPSGVQQLVCCDVIPLGEERNQLNGKMQHRVRLRFQSTHRNKAGHRFLVQRKFVWSMYKTSALRKFMETWRGRPMTDSEADDFDFEKAIGVNAFADIAHVERKGVTYADIMHAMRLPPGVQRIQVERYIRVQDRPTGAAASGTGYEDAPSDTHDEAPAAAPSRRTAPPRPAAPTKQTPAVQQTPVPVDDPFDAPAPAEDTSPGDESIGHDWDTPDTPDFVPDVDDSQPVSDDDIPF
jgi:hypothetical protein